MFRESFEIYKPVADRIQAKIKERKLRIKMEIGQIRDGDQVVVHFQYHNYEEFSRVVTEAVNEE